MTTKTGNIPNPWWCECCGEKQFSPITSPCDDCGNDSYGYEKDEDNA